MVGRRDAYWASGGSAVTNSLLLSAVWVVGAVFADRNAPALGGILNQQGVGNSTYHDKIHFCILCQAKIKVIKVKKLARKSAPGAPPQESSECKTPQQNLG